MLEEAEISAMKIPELKQYLRRRGQSGQGKKTALVQRLLECMAKELEVGTTSWLEMDAAVRADQAAAAAAGVASPAYGEQELKLRARWKRAREEQEVATLPPHLATLP